MTKFVLASLVFVFIASIGIRPADAQDIQGRWISYGKQPRMADNSYRHDRKWNNSYSDASQKPQIGAGDTIDVRWKVSL